MAADQFCLRWNNFQVNITSALESLKSDEDLVDVTLTCEGQNVKAHKVILSACSPYFRNVFKENPCQHPVVILKDVKYEDVTALLNFMYHGEVYISQDRLAPFLHTAELLQVRGLTGAANPFRDFQTPSPTPQSKPRQQQSQVKVKKSSVQSQSGQMRRVTPPLTVSPSAVPFITPVKVLKGSTSSLVSPPFKDLSTSVISSIVKEKAKESVLSCEPEVDLTAKSVSPGGMTLQVPPLSTNFSVSNEQAGTSYSSLNPEQTTTITSPPASSATFQLPSSDSSSQLFSLSFSNMCRGQSLSQPSSPPATKRRKTFPRRFSNSQLSSDQTESPLNTSESTKELLQNSNEHIELENAFKDVSVKVEEHSGDEIYNEQDEEEESSAYPQETLSNANVEGAEIAKQKNDSNDYELLEEQEEAEEESGDMGTMATNQSMLLRSLSGKPHGISQSDGSPSACGGTSGKMTTLPHVPQCGTCPHCGQTYSNQSALKYHVRLVHTDMTNRHCCHLCPRSFALRDVFKAHMWSKHKQRC